jgi:hypothetical protein
MQEEGYLLVTRCLVHEALQLLRLPLHTARQVEQLLQSFCWPPALPAHCLSSPLLLLMPMLLLHLPGCCCCLVLLLT